MGELNIHSKSDDHSRIRFLGHLIDDLKCLEHMFKNKMIEDDIIRIGAEQEMCLVNKDWRPAKSALEILKEVNDPHFTTELALYNLEINLDPVELEGKAFSTVENQINFLLKKAKAAAEKYNSRIVLTGILPSISTNETELEFMTPKKRYFALNDYFKEARGGDFKLFMMGVDELSIKHHSVMFEACNTSFQMHLQVNPEDFTSSYNWAQAIAGPVMGVSVNSPLLFGKELWSETRIALFQQSIDTRAVSAAQTEKEARVSFGSKWLEGSVVDYYKNEVSRFRPLITKEIDRSSLEDLKEGKIPKLDALNLLNGTIYKWNRPCYGIGNGKPHIRIENRYVPSGPTVLDEMANFAFWIGLMLGRPAEFDDVPSVMDFRDARSNFIRAARTGSETVIKWKGKAVPLDQLVLRELIPIAKSGLEKMKIKAEDIDRYLNVIKKRLLNQCTGSQWIVNNYRELKNKLKPNDALIALTEALYKNEQSGNCIAEWPAKHNLAAFESNACKVGHLMTTEVVTASASDVGLLALQYMKWNNIHHLPVVDHNELLVGLITQRHLEQYWDRVNDSTNLISTREIMVEEVISVEKSTPIKKAIELMKKHVIGCLPVVQGKQLIGIITIKDLAHLDND